MFQTYTVLKLLCSVYGILCLFHASRFATVMLGSENSCRLLMEKLPKRELHGQTPVVTYATRQALKQFDTQPRKDVQPNGNFSTIILTCSGDIAVVGSLSCK